MCGFTFTVFLSAFQLLPTAPFHILDLGGSTFASGLFLGFLTYSSAFSAPLTGAFADRVGQRRVLILSSLAITVFSIAYALLSDFRWILVIVVIHGIFWSGLLSASAAYMTNMLPERRRAEGIGYWGLSSILAIAIAPTAGFWIYSRGWVWLCLESAALNIMMAAIAWRLPANAAAGAAAIEDPLGTSTASRPATDGRARAVKTGPIEWRVLVMSLTLFLFSFGYGGITSFAALYADANGVRPKGLYLTTLALVILVTRPMAGRLGDRWGYKRVFIPCLVVITIGLACLALGGTRPLMIVSAIIFGVGFGTSYPVWVGYVMRDISASRRGAAFGAILAAFDTGIGTGSTTMGWIIQHYDFQAAFGTAAALSALALPYFLVVARFVEPRQLPTADC